MNAPFFSKLCAQKYKVQFVEIYIYINWVHKIGLWSYNILVFYFNINWVYKIGLWNYIYNIF